MQHLPSIMVYKWKKSVCLEDLWLCLIMFLGCSLIMLFLFSDTFLHYFNMGGGRYFSGKKIYILAKESFMQL